MTTTIEVLEELQREGQELVDTAKQLLPTAETFCERAATWLHTMKDPYGDDIPDAVYELPLVEQLMDTLLRLTSNFQFAVFDKADFCTPTWAEPFEACRLEMRRHDKEGQG